MLPSNMFYGASMLLSLPAISAYATASFFCIPGKSVTTKEQSINFARFVQTLYVNKDVPAAFDGHALESYIQYNPLVASGRQATIDFLSGNFPNWNVTIRNQGFDNDIGWLHWKLEGFGTERYNAVVDVFMYEDSCIAEHWDAIQAVPPEDRVNPLELI